MPTQAPEEWSSQIREAKRNRSDAIKGGKRSLSDSGHAVDEMAEKLLEPKLESVQPVLMSRDVVASLQFYEKLGFKLAGQDAPENPRYARIQRDNVELHLQWHDPREWNYPNDRPSYRFVVPDVDGLYEQFRESGALADATPVTETPWGTREFHVRDNDLNVLQFYRWL
jgi:uncharacterized glyoxalase superfamily protein PhnB